MTDEGESFDLIITRHKTGGVSAKGEGAVVGETVAAQVVGFGAVCFKGESGVEALVGKLCFGQTGF